MSMIEERIRALGYQVPEPAKPVAVYAPGVYLEGMVYTSGHLNC